METINIGFTGNRHGLRIDQKDNIILLLNHYISNSNNIIVSHGDCVGADTIFHNLCLNYKKTHSDKLMIHIYPPNNSALRANNKADIVMDEAPYLERNLNIIKNSSILIACPIDKNNEELRSGTWSTIRKARKLNKIIHIL